MRILSKSKIMAYRQCPKRLWLEVNHPEWREDSSATQASFSVGHQVGDIAQHLYDPEGTGVLIDAQSEGFEKAFSRTQSLLQTRQPVFEAGFKAEGALAFADVMLPVANSNDWRMVEVKSSTSVKDIYRDDVAVQTFVARASGVPLRSVALTHIDSGWIYPGDGNYCGLLVEADLTHEATEREQQVRLWIADAQKVLKEPTEPEIRTGEQCSSPYDCGFLAHCQSQEPQATIPIHWLPGRLPNRLTNWLEANNVIELSEVPDELLNEKQQRVKNVTLSGQVWFDQPGAAKALAQYKLPAYFLDFETIQFAVPIWKGTRPYQQIPFQFSVHKLNRAGRLEADAFLDLSGNDPSAAFAHKLIHSCGKRGPIYVYNAGFETARIRELAERFPNLSTELLALNARVVDLLPVAREFYYHPDQHGSWSIKAVLPAMCPDLKYSDLAGVQDGGMAMDAFLEAIARETSDTRKEEIRQQLLAYCNLDTFAMVRIWAEFTEYNLC